MKVSAQFQRLVTKRLAVSFFLFFILYSLFFILLPTPVFANCNNFTVPDPIITGSTLSEIRITNAQSGKTYTLNAYRAAVGTQRIPTKLAEYTTSGTEVPFQNVTLTLSSGQSYYLMAEVGPSGVDDFCRSNNFQVVPVPTPTRTPTPTLPAPGGNLEITSNNQRTGATVTVGEPVQIKVSNIPLNTPETYNLSLSEDNGSTAGIQQSQFNFEVKDPPSCDLKGLSGSPWDPQGPPQENGSSCTVTVNIKTNQLGINNQAPHTYNVWLVVASSGRPGQTSFTVNPVNYKPSFEIKFISGGVPVDQAEPGQDITLMLTGIDKTGEYEYGIGNERGKLNGDSKSQCNSSPDCVLPFKVPANIKVSPVTISVFDPDGKVSTKPLNIINITGAIGNQILPTPTPTTAPTGPPPPCSKWVDLNGAPAPTPVSSDEAKNLRCAEVDTAVGPVSTDPAGLVAKIFTVVLSLSGGIAVILIIVSGYKLIFSQGNPEKAQAARETLTSAIVGLLFIIFSLAILQIIGVDILKIPGFG